MDGQVSVGNDGALLVDGLTDDVHDSSQSGGADWHHDRVSSVIDLLSSDESFSGVEGNSSDVVASQMLGDFQNKFVLDALDLQGVENGWKVALELHVDDSTNHLGNLSHRESSGTETSYNSWVRKSAAGPRREARGSALTASVRSRSSWRSVSALVGLLTLSDKF